MRGAGAQSPFTLLRMCTWDNPSITATLAHFPALIFSSHHRFPPLAPFFSPSIVGQARVVFPLLCVCRRENPSDLVSFAAYKSSLPPRWLVCSPSICRCCSSTPAHSSPLYFPILFLMVLVIYLICCAGLIWLCRADLGELLVKRQVIPLHSHRFSSTDFIVVGLISVRRSDLCLMFLLQDCRSVISRGSPLC